MNIFGNFIKPLARKMLLREYFVPEEIKRQYEAIGFPVGERTFYYGLKRFRATTLLMESAPGTAETVMSMVAQLPKNTKILDFGCGQHQSNYLRHLGFTVHSCDILPFQLDNFTQIDPKATVLPFADKSFDVAVISEVVEHVESPWEILKELIRVTKQSIVVTTPNPMSLRSRQVFKDSGYLHWFAPSNFEYHITPVFFWQMELFCKRHNVHLKRSLGNHEILGLGNHGNMTDYAESIVYEISIS